MFIASPVPALSKCRMLKKSPALPHGFRFVVFLDAVDPLVMTSITIENGLIGNNEFSIDFQSNNLIFHSYVGLPEGIP